MRRRLPFVLVLALATSLVGCDQATKHLARTRLTGGAPTTLVRGALDLRLRENVGAAFSLLGDLPAAVRRPVLLAFPLVATPLLVLLLWRRRRAAWPTTLGLALVLGGTVGNLLDRALRDGRVTDFVFVHHYAVFNAADVFLVVGIGLLVLARPRAAPAAAGWPG